MKQWLDEAKIVALAVNNPSKKRDRDLILFYKLDTHLYSTHIRDGQKVTKKAYRHTFSTLNYEIPLITRTCHEYYKLVRSARSDTMEPEEFKQIAPKVMFKAGTRAKKPRTLMSLTDYLVSHQDHPLTPTNNPEQDAKLLNATNYVKRIIQQTPGALLLPRAPRKVYGEVALELQSDIVSKSAKILFGKNCLAGQKVSTISDVIVQYQGAIYIIEQKLRLGHSAQAADSRAQHKSAVQLAKSYRWFTEQYNIEVNIISALIYSTFDRLPLVRKWSFTEAIHSFYSKEEKRIRRSDRLKIVPQEPIQESSEPPRQYTREYHGIPEFISKYR
jgi:hypothetical protein